MREVIKNLQSKLESTKGAATATSAEAVSVQSL